MLYILILCRKYQSVIRTDLWYLSATASPTFVVDSNV